jgi:hypothetical protein
MLEVEAQNSARGNTDCTTFLFAIYGAIKVRCFIFRVPRIFDFLVSFQSLSNHPIRPAKSPNCYFRRGGDLMMSSLEFNEHAFSATIFPRESHFFPRCRYTADVQGEFIGQPPCRLPAVYIHLEARLLRFILSPPTSAKWPIVMYKYPKRLAYNAATT